jgi:outer membrane protein TolC
MDRQQHTYLSGAARWKRALAIVAVATGCGLCVQTQAPAQQPNLMAKHHIVEGHDAARGTVFTLTLDEAVAKALDNQPTIAAARASLNATHAAREVAFSRFSDFAGPQIKYRRKQADLGVNIGEASVLQARLEATNAVTRTYVAVLFAKEQHDLAQRAVDRIKVTRDVAKALVDAGSKEVTKADLDRLDTFHKIGQSRVGEANVGIARALAALREAIGLDDKVEIRIPESKPGERDVKLSDLYDAFIEFEKKNNSHLSCRLAIAAAQDKRPELMQASLLSQIHCLEIEAQRADCCSIYSKTFAATSDVHSRILPASIINGDYRPGPVGPEMPAFLAGMPNARAQRACFYYERSLAVLQKANNLITLEVEECCVRLKEQIRQIELLKEASAQAKKLVDDAMVLYRNDQMKTEQLLTIQLLEAQASSSLNEAYFKFGQAIGLLQRATAGELWNCFEKADEKK